MRKVCVLLICFFTLLQVSAADYQVVPLPQSIQHQEGAPFMIDETVRIVSGTAPYVSPCRSAMDTTVTEEL